GAMPGLPVFGTVPETPSFPSGHAANAVASAFVLTTAYPRTAAVWFTWLAAAIVGVARVYLGVHYPLDALAGAVVGLCCGAVARGMPLPAEQGRSLQPR